MNTEQKFQCQRWMLHHINMRDFALSQIVKNKTGLAYIDMLFDSLDYHNSMIRHYQFQLEK